MKTNKISKTTGLILICLGFIYFSCSKSADQSLTKENKDQSDSITKLISIDEKDLTESDEDLTTVDYKEFYDQLSLHGDWIQVRPEEIGMNPNIALTEISSGYTLSNLMGIKDVVASTSEITGMTYVWKPSIELGLSRSDGGAREFIPYTNGQWINTDAGWYFKGATPVEETTSHYGRWVNSPTAGWLWVPGRVWAPAWVDWKQNDTYVSWAPLPPSAYFVNDVINVPSVNENNYVIVERRYFLEPVIFQYNNPYYDNGNRILISEMTGITGLVVVNNVVINRGPDVNVIQKTYGRDINIVKIHNIKNYGDIRYSDKEYMVYKPNFKRFKNKESKWTAKNEPKSFKKYDEVKVRKSDEKESDRQDKSITKENKGNVKTEKNTDMNKKRESNGNDNVKKNDGRDNSKKNDAKDNGKKNDGKDNGNENNGNNNEKKNGNGDKEKGKK